MEAPAAGQTEEDGIHCWRDGIDPEELCWSFSVAVRTRELVELRFINKFTNPLHKGHKVNRFDESKKKKKRNDGGPHWFSVFSILYLFSLHNVLCPAFMREESRSKRVDQNADTLIWVPFDYYPALTAIWAAVWTSEGALATFVPGFHFSRYGRL